MVDNIMFILILLFLLINFSELSSQLIFTSLKMPHKDTSSASSSSSSSNQQNSAPLLNYYYPYYHLAFNDSDSIPDEQRLMAQLLRNYDPSARPVYNASNTVSVAFGIALTQLSDMVCYYYKKINKIKSMIWNYCRKRNLLKFYANISKIKNKSIVVRR